MRKTKTEKCSRTKKFWEIFFSFFLIGCVRLDRENENNRVQWNFFSKLRFFQKIPRCFFNKIWWSNETLSTLHFVDYLKGTKQESILEITGLLSIKPGFMVILLKIIETTKCKVDKVVPYQRILVNSLLCQRKFQMVERSNPSAPMFYNYFSLLRMFYYDEL